MSGTTNDVILRPATDDDQPFLVRLFASTRVEELQALAWNPIQAEMFLNIQYKAQQQSYRLSYPSAENNIILRDDEPVGRILVDRNGDVIHLVDIAILPEYRNHGVGTKLIKDLLEEGNAHGRSVLLSVFHGNPAVHLYERLGFSKVGEESLYWEMQWLPVQATANKSNSNPN